MAKKFKRTLALTMVLCMLTSVLPMQVLAADSETTTETITDGNLTTEITTTTTTTTDEETGNVTVTIEIQQNTSGETEDGAVVESESSDVSKTVSNSVGTVIESASTSEITSVVEKDDEATITETSSEASFATTEDGVDVTREEATTTTTTVAADGTITEQTVTDGSEKKEWTEDIVSGTKVDVPLEEGKTNTTESTPEVPPVSGDLKEGEDDTAYDQTTTTVIPGNVTVTSTDVKITETVIEKVVDEEGNVVSGTDLDYVVSEAKPVQGNETTGTKDNGLVIWIYRDNRTELPQDGEEIELKDGYEYKYLGAGNTSQFLPVYLYGEPADADEEPIYVDADGKKYYSHYQGTAQYNESFIGGQQISLEDAITATFGVAQQFVLVDGATGELITAYCADAETATEKGFNYYIENLEDADYYNEEQAAMIRTIAKNGYWGTASGEEGSLDNMKAMLREAKDENGNSVFTEEELALLNDGMALAVTQMAIWSYSNKIADINFFSAAYTNEGNASGELKTNWASQLLNKNAEMDDSYKMMYKLYDYMINMDPTPVEEKDSSEVIMNADNFLQNMSVTVIDKADNHVNNQDENSDNDAYVTDISFALVVTPSTENGDDMIVQIIGANGVIAEARIAGEASEGEMILTPDENGNYTFSNITLVEGEHNFNINLKGIQNLKKGVYLYTSEVVTTEEGDISSQTLVGLAGGKHAVNLNMELTFELNVEDDVFVTERVWHDESDPIVIPPEQENDGPVPMVFRLNNQNAQGNLQEIEEEPVPLASPAVTGDGSVLWIALILLSAFGIAAVNLQDKKRRNETF